MLCWSPQEQIPFSQLRAEVSSRPITFHILSSISFSRQSCWNELINSSKAAPLSAIVTPFTGGGPHVDCLHCWWLQSPPDPSVPLRLWTQQNQKIAWIGSIMGLDEPKQRLGRWGQWPMRYTLPRCILIKAFVFWQNWEGAKLACGDLGGVDRVENNGGDDMALRPSLHYLMRCIREVEGREA